MTTTAFDPSILNSSTSLTQFLSGDQEAAAIIRPRANVPSFAARQVSLIDTEEIYSCVSSYFLTLASYLTHALCMKSLSRHLWVLSRHAMSDACAIKTQAVFQNNLLARSINIHRKDSQDFYQLPPQPTSLQTQPLNFFQELGSCRGMCHWFVHLYFKTKNHFTDSDQHIRAVGEQFEQGAPRQAAFLQSLTIPPINDLLLLGSPVDDLLHLQSFRDYSTIATQRRTPDQIIHDIQCRTPGVYGIYTSSHQVIYIKRDDARQYIFDPIQGCVKVHSTTLFKNAMQRYFESHDNTRNILVDHYSPRG